MNRMTSVTTVLVFLVTILVGGPALADEHERNREWQDDDRHGEKQYDGDRKWRDGKDWDRDKKDWDHEEKDWMKHWKRKMKRWGNGVGLCSKQYGERHMKHGRKKIKHLYNKATKHLDLSAEQTNELSDIYFEMKMELIDLTAEKKKQHLELKRMKQRDDASRSDWFEAIDKMFDTKASMKKTKLGFKLDMKDILEDSQWKQLKKTMKGNQHKKGHGDKQYREKDRDQDDRDDY